MYVILPPPHHGMACPGVADGRDGHQMWRVHLKMGVPPAWGLGEELNTRHFKKD